LNKIDKPEATIFEKTALLKDHNKKYIHYLNKDLMDVFLYDEL